MEIRDNETIYVWSTEWAGARVFDDCDDGCSMKIVIDEESQTCEIDSSNITNTINYYTDASRDLQKIWLEGDYFTAIGNAINKNSSLILTKQAAAFDEQKVWFQENVMPDMVALEDALTAQTEAETSLEKYKAHYQSLNKSTSVIIAVKDDYIKDLDRMNNYLFWGLAACGLMILHNAGIFTDILESAQGLRSRV